MKKIAEKAGKKCPKCGKTENQIKPGYNASVSQRCKRKECSVSCTINPKQHAYPEGTRKPAIIVTTVKKRTRTFMNKKIGNM